VNRVIWKFPIGFHDVVTIPKGAEFLHFGIQSGMFSIWMLVDPDAPKVKARFQVVGTGADLSDIIEQGGEHGGTVIVEDAGLVWHLFGFLEEKEVENVEEDR
jgi:hypothetical protein